VTQTEKDASIMISLEDCIGLCGLDEDEVAAIAEHEHIPEIAAAALASCLAKQPHGGEIVRTMIIDDIHKALDEGRVRHAAELFMALRHFLEHHPEGGAGFG
jgi:hypothetical protein